MQFPFPIEVAKLYAIVTSNCYVNGLPNLRASSTTNSDPLTRPPDQVSLALYVLPTYLNHSCVPNAMRDMLGDVITIRARQKIAKGEEITVSYIDRFQPYELRALLLKPWFDKCDCQACEWDHKTDPKMLVTRWHLWGLSFGSTSVQAIRDLAKQIDGTYPKFHGPFRHLSSDVYTRLALALMSIAPHTFNPKVTYEQAVKEAMTALNRQGIRITDQKTTSTMPQRDSDRKTLPIAMDKTPHNLGGTMAVVFMIVEIFVCLHIDWRAEKWMRAALWCEYLPRHILEKLLTFSRSSSGECYTRRRTLGIQDKVCQDSKEGKAANLEHTCQN
jgi:hypothetical protein